MPKENPGSVWLERGLVGDAYANAMKQSMTISFNLFMACLGQALLYGTVSCEPLNKKSKERWYLHVVIRHVVHMLKFVLRMSIALPPGLPPKHLLIHVLVAVSASRNGHPLSTPFKVNADATMPDTLCTFVEDRRVKNKRACIGSSTCHCEELYVGDNEHVVYVISRCKIKSKRCNESIGTTCM